MDKFSRAALLRANSAWKSSDVDPWPNSRVRTAEQMMIWRPTTAPRPTVLAAKYIQIIGSKAPRREGLAWLDRRHVLKSQAVGMKASGVSRAVRGEAKNVRRRIVDGGDREQRSWAGREREREVVWDG